MGLINNIDDLTNLKNESKTWASQIKFYRCVEEFIQKICMS
jgi:hypothetical protein